MKSVHRSLIACGALVVVALMAAARLQSNDFRAYRWAAASVFSNPSAVYRDIPWAAFGTAVPPFVYPPTAILFLLPLSWLSASSAAGIFFCASVIAAGVISLTMLPKLLAQDQVGTEVGTIIIVTTLFNYPLYSTLISGQVNVLIALLLVAFCVFHRRRQTLLAGALLASAIAIKIYPLLFVVPLLLKRRFAEVAAVGSFVGLFVATAALVFPPSLWSDWIALIVAPGGFGRLVPGLAADLLSYNISLNGTFIRMLGPGGLAATLSICSGLLMLAVSSVRFERHSALSCRECAAIALVMFCASPISWVHHLSFVIPLAAPTLPAVRYRWIGMVAYATLCFKWDWPGGSWSLANVAIPTIGALALWTAVVLPEHGARVPNHLVH